MARREVVLAGGGHSHALLLRHWNRNLLPDVRLTLVSPDRLTPYSGMLPGYIAGHYTHADMHIDLARLCERTGARFVQDCVAGIDTAAGTVTLATVSALAPDLSFDLLSLDIGTSPDRSVPGVAVHARPVKPIAGFVRHWQQVVDQLRTATTRHHVVMVGGGPGSVEVVLAMAHAVQRDPRLSCKPRFTLLTRNKRILPTYPARVVDAALTRCKHLGVEVLANWNASCVQPGFVHGQNPQCPTRLAFDHLFWCAGAGAASWLRHTGLELTADGFIRVDSCLQSVNCPTVFAAGDIASLAPEPVPRAGVFAVRQAAVLHANLLQALKHEKPRRFVPQRRFLTLLALGGKTASGKRGALAFSGSWVWHWKNFLDRRFMKQFHDDPLHDSGRA